MIVYRSSDEWVSTATRLRELDHACAEISGRRGDALHDAVRALVIDLGVLESAVHDALCPERDWTPAPVERLHRVTLDAAAALVHSWVGERVTDAMTASLVAKVREVSALSLPNRVRVRVPEGYAYYGLYPEMYVDSTTEFWSRSRPTHVTIIGLRSIGVSLGAVAQATLARRGVPCAWINIRPRGHPFDRRPRLTPGATRSLRRWVSEGGHFLIVDEGPGRSGSSFLGTADALVALGAPSTRVALAPSWNASGDALVADEAKTRWCRYARFPASFSKTWTDSGRLQALCPDVRFRNVSAGRWRRLAFTSARCWPGVQPQHEQRKYLLEPRSGAASSAKALMKFAGLGRYGAAKEQRASILAEAGFTPCARLGAAGWFTSRYVEGRPLTRGSASPSMITHVGRYLGFVHRTFTLERRPEAATLLDMVEQNAAACLDAGNARAVRRLLDRYRSTLDAEYPVAGDGRMLPHEWIRSGPRLLKTDALDHHADHFFPGPQDPAWDLAAFVVEFELDESGARALVASYARARGRRPRMAQLPAFLVAYAVYRTAYTTFGARTLAGTADGQRLAADAARYRLAARRWLARASPPSTARRLDPGWT